MPELDLYHVHHTSLRKFREIESKRIYDDDQATKQYTTEPSFIESTYQNAYQNANVKLENVQNANRKGVSILIRAGFDDIPRKEDYEFIGTKSLPPGKKPIDELERCVSIASGIPTQINNNIEIYFKKVSEEATRKVYVAITILLIVLLLIILVLWKANISGIY